MLYINRNVKSKCFAFMQIRPFQHVNLVGVKYANSCLSALVWSASEVSARDVEADHTD